MMAFMRRDLMVKGTACLWAATLAGSVDLMSNAVPANAQAKRLEGRTPEQWMKEWMDRSRNVEGGLYISRFADPIYFLTKPIAWKPNPGQEAYGPVNIPIGFVTDFASVPRVFWWLLRPDGEYAYAAVIHDYLYWVQDREKDVADMTFKFAMEDFKIDPIEVGVIYRAVRLGGRIAWNNNARLKAKGEKRILKRFPNDPRTRWQEWKARTDVFET
jgi:hypothetical protein